MEVIQGVIDALGSIPASAWGAIGAALGISVILEGLKHKLSLQSDKVITFLLGALSFMAAAIDYLTQASLANPTILGQETVAIVGLATILYRYVVKPLTNLVKDAKEYRQRKDRIAESGEADIQDQNLIPLDEVEPQIPLIDEAESVEPVKSADF